MTNDVVWLPSERLLFIFPILSLSNFVKGTAMEIINIEKKAFETMIACFEQFAAKVQTVCNRYDVKRMNEWYDNQDVCRILKISPRKLQSLRDSGALPCVKINRKIYYKPEDVQSVIRAICTPAHSPV